MKILLKQPCEESGAYATIMNVSNYVFLYFSYFIELYMKINYSNCYELNWRDLDHQICINNKKVITVNFLSLYRIIQH